MQKRALKLRIYDDEEHPFTDDPRVVKWEMPPRRLRIKEPLFELPEGFEPMNKHAYGLRFGHMLPEAALESVKSRNNQSLIRTLDEELEELERLESLQMS